MKLDDGAPISLVNLSLALISVTPHERWFLMRGNTGYPFIITLLLSYPSALPSADHLQNRIIELQEHFPQLRCQIKDARTRKPFWEEGSPAPVVREVYGSQTQVEIIAREQQQMKGLWQVTLYHSSTSYLAVSALHELIDGRGILRLAQALVSSEISTLPYERLSTSTYPSSIDLRPSYRLLLSSALAEYILPWLPQSLASYLSSPVWPQGLQKTNPLDLPGALLTFSLPISLLDLLKSLGRFHGVPTLTPILLTAWLVAMNSSLPTELPLSASIAVDERKTALQHSYCTGLYHASHLYSLDVRESTSFWSATRDLSLQIANPASLSLARMRMGMLAYLPDGTVHPSRRDDPKRPTAWEDWQLERNSSLTSYVSSVNFSNLGKIDLPPGAEDILVASSPSIGDPPMKLVLTGHQKGLNMAVTFRDGDILDESQVREMGQNWTSYLQRLVSGKGEDITFGEICKSAQS